MTHSVGNVPSQQAVKLVVVGPGFVEQCWFGLFLGDYTQWKMGWIREMALQPVSRLMRKTLLLLPSRQTSIKLKLVYSRMLPVPFLVINCAIMTSHHLCVTQLPWFYKRPYYLSIFRFLSSLREIWIVPKKIQQYDVIMTSDYAILSIKLRPEVGDDEYIIVCYFGDRRMSGFEVIEGGLRSAHGRRKEKKFGWIGLI